MDPSEDRYKRNAYRRCGRSGLLLPSVSLGCWHNFGGKRTERQRDMLCRAFDLGITHFDLANNYGPPPGSAEENVGRILRGELAGYRDELIISTKAGYRMWPGPYGEWGSKKYLMASLDQSLRRLQLDYVDIFYSHRFDPTTPLDETMAALEQAVRQGKALYVGISSYDSKSTSKAAQLLLKHDLPLLIHQPNYSLLNRFVEADKLLETTSRLGVGVIAFCPLAQGLLTDKYLEDVPPGSRASRIRQLRDRVTPELRDALRQLNTVAQRRGQTLAQMSLSWLLRDERIASVLIGASKPSQIEENVQAANAPSFSAAELNEIDAILDVED